MKRWLLLVAGLVGCDASEPSPYVPTYDPNHVTPVASTEFCPLLARNTCAVLRPCCEALPFSFDENKCRQAVRIQCEARRTKSMELGLLYDDLQGGRCVAGHAILLPHCATPLGDPLAADVYEACRLVFHGNRRVGEPCEGKHPLECAPPRLGARVACEAGRCVERPLLQGGEACAGGRGFLCAAGLVCTGDPPRCTARFHPVGARCVPAHESRPDVPVCGSELDRTCDELVDPPRCVPLPAFGERCTPSIGCAKPWRCDTDRAGEQRCTDAKPLGQQCNDDKECSTKLCAGAVFRACVPAGMGPPIARASLAKEDPTEYVARIAAACSGVIPEGAGSLAPFLLPTETK